jgi:hypothetical protein
MFVFLIFAFNPTPIFGLKVTHILGILMYLEMVETFRTLALQHGICAAMVGMSYFSGLYLFESHLVQKKAYVIYTWSLWCHCFRTKAC